MKRSTSPINKTTIRNLCHYDGMKCSAAFLQAIDEATSRIYFDAVAEAKAKKRKTLLYRDVPALLAIMQEK